MPVLRLAHNDIPRRAVTTSASAESVDRPHQNLFMGSAAAYWSRGSVGLNSRVVLDMGSGNTALADYSILHGLNLLLAAKPSGTVDVSVQVSDDNSTYQTLYKAASLAAANLIGSYADTLVFQNNYFGPLSAAQGLANSGLNLFPDDAPSYDLDKLATRMTVFGGVGIKQLSWNASTSFGRLQAIAGRSYTATFYLKYINRQFLLCSDTNDASTRSANIDVLNGTLNTSTNVTAVTIKPMGNGWLKVDMTYPRTNSGDIIQNVTMSATGVTTVAGASFTPGGTEAYYFGDFAIKESTTYPKRYFRLDITSTASFEHILRKFYLGQFFDLGASANPTYPYDNNYVNEGDSYSSRGGGVFKSSSGRPKKQYQFNIVPITDAKRDSFNDTVLRYQNDYPAFLYQDGVVHSPLGGKGCVFGWFEGKFSTNGSWKNVNQLQLNFLEDRG